MGKAKAFLFPGQGAQYVGMGREAYLTFPVARRTFQEGEELLGHHLTEVIFQGPSAELALTKNSQVAIYVTSIALWRVLQEQLPDCLPTAVAGLSLGEYTALTASGRLSFAEGVFLVKARGLYMHEASLRHPGTMAVVLGLEVGVVQEVVGSLREVWVANLNCPGQVVISGTVMGVERAKGHLLERGAKRVLALEVSGAFHSGLMEEAREQLAPLIEAVPLHTSPVDLVMNVPGDYVAESQIRDYMVQQVVSPVLWEQGVRAMERRGARCFIEIGCGKTLTRMVKQMGLPTESFSIETPHDLDLLHHYHEASLHGFT